MKAFPLPKDHGTYAIAPISPVQVGFRAFFIAAGVGVVFMMMWFILAVGSTPPVPLPLTPAEVEVDGVALNPYTSNPLHGRHVKSVYKILECSDVFHRRPHGLPNVSMGYGQYFLRVDNTKKVGQDPEVVGFMELYSARPGSVKPCSEKRDYSDCVCDRIANVCYAEPELMSYTGIKIGMQHPLFADPYSKMSETTLFSMFKSLCTTGH